MALEGRGKRGGRGNSEGGGGSLWCMRIDLDHVPALGSGMSGGVGGGFGHDPCSELYPRFPLSRLV